MKSVVEYQGISYPLYSFNTVIVGSGAAGLNGAVSLDRLGQRDIALLTEGMNMGTSRNTGSDKQTYYKLSTAGDVPDSIGQMANSYFEGGAMQGDQALTEAANSLRCFFHLVQLGLPFVANEYGEYVGYRTDHDKACRATSCGPLTSKLMTQALEEEVRSNNIPIFDGYRVVSILRDEKRALGLVAIDRTRQAEPGNGLTIFACTNILYATGGPAGLYAASVYPHSQTCAHGAAFAAGVKGVNLTEWQYGLASTKFRWNLSGSYQQVIPRYFSTDSKGENPREFLQDFFGDPAEQMNAIFHKGYEWPFDVRKLGGGSSDIDAAVFRETVISGRRVFMDFTRNPSDAERLDFNLLPEEARMYLTRSDALGDTPIERLRKLNPKAIELYRSNGINLEKEPLEIALCAQHNNGGLLINDHSETNLPHFFAAGEAAGVFGVYRPGGAALNSTQVTSLRAAEFIAKHYRSAPDKQACTKQAEPMLAALTKTIGKLTNNEGENLFALRRRYQERMTRCGSVLRNADALRSAIEDCKNDIRAFEEHTAATPDRIIDAMINRDILLTQFSYLSAMEGYLKSGGVSRGSALYGSRFAPPESIDDPFAGFVGELQSDYEQMTATYQNVPVRPIPTGRELWFEKVYNQDRQTVLEEKQDE